MRKGQISPNITRKKKPADELSSSIARMRNTLSQRRKKRILEQNRNVSNKLVRAIRASTRKISRLESSRGNDHHFFANDTYSLIIVKGKEYKLTPGQAEVARYLYKKQKSGAIWVTSDDIMVGINRSSSSIRDLFRRNGRWLPLIGTLFERKEGLWRIKV